MEEEFYNHNSTSKINNTSIQELHQKFKEYEYELAEVQKLRGEPRELINQYSDLLSEAARKERKMLLSVSLIVLIIMKVGLFPSKIVAFGLDFESKNINTFFTLLGFVIVYFLVVFITYSFFDYRKWKLEAIKAGKEILKIQEIKFRDIQTLEQIEDGIQELLKIKEEISHYKRKNRLNNIVPPIRIFIDILFPILLGLYVLYLSFNFNTTNLNKSYMDNGGMQEIGQQQ